MPVQSLSLSFPGAGGAMLAARLDLPPAAAPIAYALFAHCFTCSKETRAVTYVSAALAERGIAVLRFDFTGLGDSGGDFAGTNFSSNVEDLVSAADYLRQHYRAPAILVGHSLGGTAVLAAARRVPEVVAVATIGSPFDPAHVLHLIKDKAAVERDGEAEVDIGGRPFRIRRQFLEDISGSKLGDNLARMGKALLVMHSPRDSVVGIDNATQIFMAARHPKNFVSLDPADHLLSRREDALFAGSILASWAMRYLVAAVDAAPAPVPGKVVVQETREGKFSQRVMVGQHVIRADEPVEAGGMDAGLSPYDLVLAGLGACTSMTIRMYADLKGIPLERATVELRHDKIHAADCAGCETKDGKVDRIERLIRLEGPLSEDQRAKLLDISNKCPVHRTLHSEVSIPTRLID
jgi:putative redox protein